MSHHHTYYVPSPANKALSQVCVYNIIYCIILFTPTPSLVQRTRPAACAVQSKEAYVYGKRALCIWQKRPMYMAKEPCVYGKRALCIWQKRPIYMAKEPYVYGKRAQIIIHMPCHPLAVLM